MTIAPAHMSSSTSPDHVWRIGPAQSIALDQPRVMGILNVTPDSFSDGGRHATPEAAVEAALNMVTDGAAIIDVGGESTRPGAEPVSDAEQVRRTVPVIKAIRRTVSGDAARLSIDTTSAAVAEAALDVGADIVNDVSAGLDDARMLPLIASRKCGVILMHRLHRPRDDVFSHQYVHDPDYAGDVYAAVSRFLQERMQAAVDVGIERDAIVIDPGLGFGKSVAQNYMLAAALARLQRELNRPAISAGSRKSFLAVAPQIAATAKAIEQRPPPIERLGASIALTLSHWQMGARLFRVHDVRAHVQALQTAAALHAEQSADNDG